MSDAQKSLKDTQEEETKGDSQQVQEQPKQTDVKMPVKFEAATDEDDYGMEVKEPLPSGPTFTTEQRAEQDRLRADELEK